MPVCFLLNLNGQRESSCKKRETIRAHVQPFCSRVQCSMYLDASKEIWVWHMKERPAGELPWKNNVARQIQALLITGYFFFFGCSEEKDLLDES